MTWKLAKILPLCLLASCSTLSDSLELGAGLGVAGGAAATYAGFSGAGRSPPGGGIEGGKFRSSMREVWISLDLFGPNR